MGYKVLLGNVSCIGKNILDPCFLRDPIHAKSQPHIFSICCFIFFSKMWHFLVILYLEYIMLKKHLILTSVHEREGRQESYQKSHFSYFVMCSFIVPLLMVKKDANRAHHAWILILWGMIIFFACMHSKQAQCIYIDSL